MVSTTATQQEDPVFESMFAHITSKGCWVRYPAGVGPSYVEFACSPRVCVGFAGAPVFSHHQNMNVGHIRLGWLNVANPPL